MPTPHPTFIAGSAVLAALQADVTLARLADADLLRVPDIDSPMALAQSRRVAAQLLCDSIMRGIWSRCHLLCSLMIIKKPRYLQGLKLCGMTGNGASS
jgi:hypothetical protein